MLSCQFTAKSHTKSHTVTFYLALSPQKQNSPVYLPSDTPPSLDHYAISLELLLQVIAHLPASWSFNRRLGVEGTKCSQTPKIPRHLCVLHSTSYIYFETKTVICALTVEPQMQLGDSSCNCLLGRLSSPFKN